MPLQTLVFETSAYTSSATPACFIHINLFVSGGAGGARTLDLLHAMQALSQLSYSPLIQLNIALPNTVVNGVISNMVVF